MALLPTVCFVAPLGHVVLAWRCVHRHQFTVRTPAAAVPVYRAEAVEGFIGLLLSLLFRPCQHVVDLPVRFGAGHLARTYPVDEIAFRPRLGERCAVVVAAVEGYLGDGPVAGKRPGRR